MDLYRPLEIVEYIPQIVDLVKNNITSLLVAPTGSGKSVAVPPLLTLVGGLQRGFVTVPTRAGVISIAARQTKLHANTGLKVGYAAESEVHYNQNTNLVYCTTGHMRLKLLKCFREYFKTGNVDIFNFADYLMVDEIHAGTLDNDIVIGLWMKANELGLKVPHLFLATATPTDMLLSPPPRELRVPFSLNYPVTTVFHDRDMPLMDNKKHLYAACGKILTEYNNKIGIDEGHFLAFCPGKKEVEYVVDYLNEKLPPNSPVQVFSLTSQTKTEDLERINDPSPGIRKIFVGTNVVEMSVTVNNLVLVVDTLCEKVAKTAPNGGAKLVIDYISLDSSKQRRGRTGRTCPGTYYVLATQEIYEALVPHRTPEVERLPLHTSVLEILDAGLLPREILYNAPGLSLNKSNVILNALQMVKEREVTEKGKLSSLFPMSIQNASFLYDWIKEGYSPYIGCVLVTILDGYDGSYYYIPSKEKNMTAAEYAKFKAQYQEENFSIFTGKTDLHTFLNIWNNFLLERGPTNAKKWCASHSINAKKWTGMFSLLTKTLNILARNGYTIQNQIIDVESAVNTARQLLPMSYAVYRHNKNTDVYIDYHARPYQLHTGDSMNLFQYRKNKPIDRGHFEYPPAIIPLLTIESGSEIKINRAIVSAFVDAPKNIVGLQIEDETQVPPSESSSKFLLQLVAGEYAATYFPPNREEMYPADVNSFAEVNNVKIDWKKSLKYLVKGQIMFEGVKSKKIKGFELTEAYQHLLSSYNADIEWYQRLYERYTQHPYDLVSLNNYGLDILQNHFSVTHELFSTPFTTGMHHDDVVKYGSWYNDVDGWFGSVGNSFTYKLPAGCFVLITLPTPNLPISKKIAEYVANCLDNIEKCSFLVISADKLPVLDQKHNRMTLEVPNVSFKSLLEERVNYDHSHTLYLVSNDMDMKKLLSGIITRELVTVSDK